MQSEQQPLEDLIKSDRIKQALEIGKNSEKLRENFHAHVCHTLF